MVARQQELTLPDLVLEIEHLKKVIKQLEDERERDRRLIAELQTQRDGFLRHFYAWSKAQHSKQELECWANEEMEGGSFAELLVEVEQKTSN